MLNVQLKRKRTFAQSMLFVVFLLSSTLAFAQNKVTGTVTDKTGEPLIGVNVLEAGTTNGCRWQILPECRKRENTCLLFYRL